MSTRKKRHLIAGTIIGGLLLAATTQTGNSFALSDTSSTSGSSPTTTTAQPAPTTTSNSTPSTTGDTPTTTTNSSTPTTGNNTSTAGGTTATQSANSGTGVTSTSATSTNPINSNTAPSTATGTDGQQPSTAPTNTTPTDSALTNNTTDKNTIKSTAKTGDATVKHTITGGDATTGNASAIATLINSIASTSNLNGGSIPTATYNVNGTQNGDIVINPEAILAAANSGNGTPVICAPGTTSAQNNATISNLVNLLAQTGNAKVTDNGVGGDATSGNATTEADIVNMIQDLVSSKGAFLGVVNINGNLNGNINLPASDINALLTPTPGDGSIIGNSTAVNNANVNNNVTLTAMSGNAAVTNNGTAGTAKSGNATTVLNMNNLINCQIAGGNLLLVFVNVMGHWYGALLSEPAGATTATLGGGITQDTILPTAQTTATNNSTINNNVHLTSISGNATVANNGVGGNATTGNATAIADVTNILGSQINLTGWLGILIINVFGTWNGSVGIQPTTSTVPDAGNNSLATPHSASAVQTGYAPHQQAVDDGYSYYIVNPPQSFDGGQFELASAHMPVADTQLPGGDNVLGSSIRPAAITTTHTARPAKSMIADFILAGVGAALALTGGVTRFFVRRPQK